MISFVFEFDFAMRTMGQRMAQCSHSEIIREIQCCGSAQRSHSQRCPRAAVYLVNQNGVQWKHPKQPLGRRRRT